MHGDERRRTRRLNDDAWTTEIQLVRDESCEKVFVVADECAIGSEAASDLRVCENDRQVVAETGAGVHADLPGVCFGVVTRIFQSFPRTLEKDALLRIADLR